MFRFRAFGIPVVVDGWFLVFMLFLYSWSGGGRPGIFAAGGIAVFTLIHELGHALTARHYGCDVNIRLNMFLGWAAFTSSRPLTRLERILISLAGPGVELVLGLLTLLVVHLGYTNSTGSTQLLFADLWRGVVWAGVVIAMLNLLPLWPLDGAHVVQKLIEKRAGERRSLRLMAIVSLVGSALLFLASFASRAGSNSLFAGVREFGRRYVFFGYEQPLAKALLGSIVAFPGILVDGLFLLPLFTAMASFQLLNQLKAEETSNRWIRVTEPTGAVSALDLADRINTAAQAAEREGWLGGQPGPFPRGWTASPWLRAWTLLRQGDQAAARATLAEVVQPGRWVAPDVTQPELRGLLTLLPDPLPVGERRRNLELLTILGRQSDAHRLVHYATALYGSDADPEILYRAAAGLAWLGEGDAAMAWLRRAVQDGPDPERLARDVGLAPLHARLDFQQLLAQVRASAPTA